MFWNNVETKPWGGFPLGWDLRVLEKLGRQDWDEAGVYAGKTLIEAAPVNERVLHFAPTDEDWMYPNVGEDDCAGAKVEGGGQASACGPARTRSRCTTRTLGRVKSASGVIRRSRRACNPSASSTASARSE
jgi:hypothetical protein